jgi:hypothetical protein
MPQFTDADAMRKHLRDALRGRKRWVFVTDSETGHRHLGALALSLWRRGISDLGCGFTGVADPATRRSCDASFLTVPKSAISWEEVRSFALSISPGAAGVVPAEPPDVLLLCKENMRLLEAFVGSAFQGALQMEGEAENN